MKNLSRPSYKSVTGPIRFNMTNDYMFRVILQKNPKVLTHIICAVLHLNPKLVQSIQITNPIELGESIDEKTFMLDINVLLNNNAIINLEMQVINEHNWQDRSLSYLCRSFDQLYQGQVYSDAKPAIHIGFLNFRPFPDYPEFFSTYKLTNQKTGMVYSDKFLLHVVDLTCIELATDEDKEFRIDAWAKFFTSTSWEEVAMIAEKNPDIAEAAQSLYEANADEIIEMQCRARRDYYKQKNTTEKMMRDLNEALEEKSKTLEQMNITLSQMDDNLKQMDNDLKQKDIEIKQKENDLKQKDIDLKQKDIDSAQDFVRSVENAMNNFNVSLEDACKALGFSKEKYESAKKLIETN